VNANPAFEIVKQAAEIVSGDAGGSMIRREEGALHQFRNALLSVGFSAKSRAPFTAHSALEEDSQAAEMEENKASGSAGKRDSGLVDLPPLGIPLNVPDAKPQAMARMVALPARALQRPIAPINQGDSVVGSRAGKTSCHIGGARQELESPRAKAQSSVERVAAAEAIVLPVAIALRGMDGQSPVDSTKPSGLYPASLETPGLMSDPREFPLSPPDHETIPASRAAQKPISDGTTPNKPALPQSGVSLPDADIESRTSAAQAAPKSSTQHNNVQSTTDVHSHEGNEGVPAEAFRTGGPREQAPFSAVENAMSGREFAQLRTAKGASPASPERLQVRAKQAALNLSGLRDQSLHSCTNSSMQLNIPHHQYFGAGIARDSSATLIGPSQGIPADARVSRSSGAGISGSEVLTVLDADGEDSVPTWIRTGKHELEAGYQDPELGWVAVRAHAATNGIHAALVPGSIAAAQPLSDHLAGLNAYLAGHHSSIHSVSIYSPELVRDELSTRQGMDHGAAQGDRREHHTGADTEPRQDLTRGSLKDPISNTQPSDAIESPADFVWQRRAISLVV